MKIRIREEYFKTIHTKSLEQQLVTSSESKPTANFNGNQRNIFPERVRVVIFFFSLSQPITEEDLIICYFDILINLAALCSQQELPVQDNLLLSFEDIEKSNEEKIDMLIDPALSLLKVSITQCFFCLGDNHFCYKDQTRKFSRPDSL